MAGMYPAAIAATDGKGKTMTKYRYSLLDKHGNILYTHTMSAEEANECNKSMARVNSALRWRRYTSSYRERTLERTNR